MIIVSKAAEGDINRAAAWYEARKEGLGDEFLSRVQEGLERIEANPAAYALAYKDLRKAQLRQFTDWALWFRINPDNSLVVACLSGRREMKIVRERAANVREMPKGPKPG